MDYSNDIPAYSEKQRIKQAIFRKTVLENPYIPKTLNPSTGREERAPLISQARFLALDEREALFGGAAGPGKSWALLVGALQYVTISGYNAIIFRRTFQDLKLPEALIHRSLEWLTPTDAKWKDQDHVWNFPSGAKLAFGYLEYEKDKYRYQSAAFQYIGFDELTQFEESQYLYLHSRLRRLETQRVPLRIRSASNPGGTGHEWVKRRFIPDDYDHEEPKPEYRKTVMLPNGEPSTVVFVPAKLEENVYLDRRTYIQNLYQLPTVERERLLRGDWRIMDSGGMFQRDWFPFTSEAPKDAQIVRYWDLAATPKKDDNDPAFTAGCLLTEKRGAYCVADMKRKRESPGKIEDLVKRTAERDFDDYGGRVEIWMEQEPGSAGVIVIDHYAREVLKGYPFRGYKETGDKVLRAKPASSAAEQGNIAIKSGPWNDAFLDELTLFPLGKHKDQVDAFSGAFRMLATSDIPMIGRA